MKHFARQLTRTIAFVLCCFVIGNSIITIILYLTGKPHLTAWTGHVMQSTPSALNDLLLGIVAFVLFIALCRH